MPFESLTELAGWCRRLARLAARAWHRQRLRGHQPTVCQCASTFVLGACIELICNQGKFP